MAFKGTLFAIAVVMGAFCLTSAAVPPVKETKKTALGEEEVDPRLFFVGTTGTGVTTGTTTPTTSITISTELLIFFGLLLAAAIAAAIAIPIAVGVGVGKKYKNQGNVDYDTGYDSGPAFAYGQDESSYASIHRSLEDAADKYN